MTDNTPRADVPAPRPPTDSTDITALARCPGPVAPGGAVAALTDQVLVHASYEAGARLLPSLPPSAPGLVLGGVMALRGVRKLRDGGYRGILIADPEGYKKAEATPDVPFVLPEGDGLFSVSLDDVLRQQRESGASVAMTPTGYLHVGESEPLKAAVAQVAVLDRDDVLLSVPIDAAWLKDEHFPQLLAILSRTQAPKVVFLGGQGDPVASHKSAVPNLRRLVSEGGHVGVFRTDLTALDAMCHGAFVASIGTGGSHRHIVSPGEPSRARAQDPSPSVLYPALMSFHKGSLLAERFANTPPPTCDCVSCLGRGLDGFLGREDTVAAHAHGVHVWSEWCEEMRSCASLADRTWWWKHRCEVAVEARMAVNELIEIPDAFKVSRPLRAWAQLPPWPSGPRPTRFPVP
ncbi:hypothetical protein [Actinokineospora inagensis]|uniref:hypothetical protein n=1 Tax=Actinokineospora inagensis TaxID=103730 RepID=UPI00041AC2F8|nr:hypothetical protein [Actinokineospora inagensis]